jgi:MFS family permease
MIIKKISLEIVVFFCGAVVMAYEIIGARILGPYVGTSMVVWSSIIGIILASLSAGYYYGGRLADRRPYPRTLALVIAVSGLYILLSLLFKNPLLDALSQALPSIPLAALLSSLVLFAFPAFLLGMVSPFAARLKIRDAETSGATAGYLYALSTFGSITGTFLAGFFLIPGFRLTSILLILGLLLLALALFLYLENNTQFIPLSKNKTGHDEH